MYSASQWFYFHENFRYSIPDIFIILQLGAPRSRWDRGGYFPDQLLA